MTPIIPALDPLPLPAPAWLLWFLLLLTFFLHVVAMNAVLGGSIVAVVARRRAGSNAHAAELARIIGKGLPVAIAATVTLGVAALLFLQVLYGRLFFTSAVLMAWLWLAVVPLVIVAYYGAYAIAFREGARLSGLTIVVAAILLSVAFIYSNNMSLMLRPEAFRDMYLASGRGWHLNLGDRVLLPRYLHMVTGAVAVAGLLVSVIGLVRRRQDAAFGAWAIGHGARWCMGGTIVNLVTGVWFLGALPTPVLLLFMGRDPVASTLLLAGIVAASGGVTLVMMGTTAAAPGRPVVGGAAAMAVGLASMLLVRDVVRRRILDLAGVQPQNWVSTDWGPIAIFAVLLVTAVALIAWMVTALVKANAERPRQELLG